MFYTSEFVGSFYRSRDSRVVSFRENNYINCNFMNVAGLVTAMFAYAVNLNNYFNLYSVCFE